MDWWWLLVLPSAIYATGAVGIWLVLMLLPWHIAMPDKVFVVTMVALGWPYWVCLWIRDVFRR